MSLSRREILAVLIALGAAVSSVVVWTYGGVDIGLTLRADNGRVYVADVTPAGIAARNGFQPGMPILDLSLVDGRDVPRGEPLAQSVSGFQPDQVFPWPWDSVGGPLTDYGPDYRPPSGYAPPDRTATVVAGEADPDTGWVGFMAVLSRAEAEDRLRGSIWIMALGAALGIGVWRLLAHGVGGALGREEAVTIAAGVATPFLIVPTAVAGAAIGVYAGYLVPAAVSLLIGLAFALRVTDASWRRTAFVSAAVGAALVAAYVLRYMTAPFSSPGEEAAILVLVAASAIVPAAIYTSSQAGRSLERFRHLSLALLPAAALTAVVPVGDPVVLPLVLLAALLGWQLVALVWPSTAVGGWWRAVLPPGSDREGETSGGAVWRDRLTLAVLGLVAVASLLNTNPWTAIIGGSLATGVAFAIQRGFLGEAWTDAAIPLAAAVAMPILILPFPAWEYGGAMGWAAAPEALVALSVAHLLAGRHGTSALGRAAPARSRGARRPVRPPGRHAPDAGPDGGRRGAARPGPASGICRGRRAIPCPGRPPRGAGRGAHAGDRGHGAGPVHERGPAGGLARGGDRLAAVHPCSLAGPRPAHAAAA